MEPHNKHLTREMAPLRINTTDAYSYRQLLNSIDRQSSINFLWVGQGFVCTKLCWEIPSESGESSSSFAPVTPLWQFCSPALFYPSQWTNALLFNSATFVKTGSNSQKYYYKLKG